MDVREHYNKIGKQTLQDRSNDTHLNIRNFNNFIKSVVLQNYVRKGDWVLDLGCGKGGDLKKFNSINIESYMGVDFALNSLKEAEKRYKAMKPRNFGASFHPFNVYKNEMSLGRVYDAVCSLFSYHYAFTKDFDRKISARNVACHLKTNGFFIMTIPRCDEIERRRSRNDLKNSFFEITFDRDDSPDYYFKLGDCVDNCKETLFDFAELEKDMNKFFKILRAASAYSLAAKMHVQKLTSEEEQVVDLYEIVVFQKDAKKQ